MAQIQTITMIILLICYASAVMGRGKSEDGLKACLTENIKLMKAGA